MFIWLTRITEVILYDTIIHVHSLSYLNESIISRGHTYFIPQCLSHHPDRLYKLLLFEKTKTKTTTTGPNNTAAIKFLTPSGDLQAACADVVSRSSRARKVVHSSLLAVGGTRAEGLTLASLTTSNQF